MSSGTYYAAVMENRSDFAGRVVVDVGAGSGILSMFAAQVCIKMTCLMTFVLFCFCLFHTCLIPFYFL